MDGHLRRTITIGLIGGLIGGISIWLYEAIVLVGLEHQLSAGFFSNGTGLVFGQHAQQSLGLGADVLGTAIHFTFSLVWGVIFAAIWPFFRDRRFEATLVALFYAAFAWIVMHTAISLVGDYHPNYLDPIVITGGFVSHIFYTVPLALYVKSRMAN